MGQQEPGRRTRGLLAEDLNRFCVMYVSGEFTLEEGKFLTPHIIGRVMSEIEGTKPPSVGATARVFEQWEAKGYARMRQNPYAFVDFTDLGRELGYEEFMERKPWLAEAEPAASS